MKLTKMAGFRKPLHAGLPAQLYRVMRLTTLLLFAACLAVQAHGYGQERLTLSEKDAPLPKVFQAIERQSDYHFFYDYNILPPAAKVSLDVKNASIEQVLDICFKDQPLAYSIVGKLVVVKEKEAKSKNDAVPSSTIAELRGVITSENGEPLVGASVGIKGGKKGVFSNEKGVFILKNIPSDAVLEITFTGYQPKQVKIDGSNSLIIALQVATGVLDQVQIIAYGTTTQRLSTSNITTIKSQEIATQPVSNPLLALEGRTPGLFISQSTGVPGSGINVRIQGQNSLSRGSDPLYIIDGMPYTSQLLPNISGVFGILGGNGNTAPGPSGGGNPLAFINPLDIESIDILKDADATAIYGSRAANGAILITTKKGSNGATKVDLNVQSGAGKITRTMPLLNTSQYLQMRREGLMNDGIAADSNLDFDLLQWDTTRFTNWQKLLLGNTMHYNDMQAAISGGNNNLTFLVGAGFHKETSVFSNTLGDQKISTHISLSNTSINKKFKFQITASYMVDDNHLIGQDLTNLALNLAPDAPSLYNKDASLNWAPLANGNSSWLNPLSFLNSKYLIKTNNLIGSALLSYQILPCLKLQTNLGYTDLETVENNIYPMTMYAPETRIYNSRISIFGTSTIKSWNFEPQLEFKKRINKNLLDVLVGATLLENDNNLQQLIGSGYNSDQALYDISAAPFLSAYNPAIVSKYKYSAFFGRFNYNFDNKYILDLNARRDGSSRFGSDNQFHNFGSIAAAWVFTNEDYLKKQMSALSFGKIKVSYGTTGNDQIGDYQYLSLYSPVTNIGNPYQGATGLAPTNLANPYIEWEESKKLQAGIDIGLFKDVVFLSGNYYLNRSSNQLQNYSLPAITGNTSIQENLPAKIENYGWELTANAKVFKSHSFEWSISGNFTLPKNKLLAYPGLDSSSYASSYVIGQPITIVRVYKYIGVDESTGLYNFSDKNGHPTSSPVYPDDLSRSVNLSPKYYGGIENSFRFKSINLSFLFQYVKQIGTNYLAGRFPGRFISNTYGTVIGNQPIWVLNRWQKPGDQPQVQMFSSTYPQNVADAFNAVGMSSFAYSDASFIRLKNISLSWSIPAKWQQRAHLSNIKLYVQAQNLLTVTSYKGMDPENQSVTAIPPLKVITAGLQLTF